MQSSASGRKLGQIRINKVEVCFSPIFRSPELTQIIMDVFDYLEFIYLSVLPRLAPAQELCHVHIILGHLAPCIKVLQRNKIDSLSLKSQRFLGNWLM